MRRRFAKQKAETNTTININTNAVTKQSKTTDATVGLQSSKVRTVKPTSASVPMNVKAVCKAETCKAEDRPTERPTESFALSIDTNAVTREAKATEEATVVDSVKQHGRV
jgi:hypothetical protein